MSSENYQETKSLSKQMVILARHCLFTWLLCFKPCEVILRENFADHMMALSCFYLERKRGAIIYKEA